MAESANVTGGLSEETPICAIGASAGGVKALQDFFALIGDDLGVAFVVILHIPPDRPSQLSEILAARTNMPVQQVETEARLQPNCVYVIPPDGELVISGNEVKARPFTEPRGRRAPIDMFFRSVAAGRGDGLAIVLSGSGSDGALGVRAIKEAGGVIFVQDPTDAEYPIMPRSALATGIVDFVGPIDRLTGRISEVMRSKKALRALRDEDAVRDIRDIVGFLRARTGHDFSNYKRPTVMRRIGRRMQVSRQDSLSAYYDYLRDNPEEAQELLSDLLISVTMFFRDRDAFSMLTEKAIKPLLEKADEDGPIRVWVVGCATGEEAYSIAILMLEEAERRGIRPAIQIFASDLDEGALATAREGRYPKTIEADVSDERIRRYFVEDGSHYRVKKEVRELVLFASHSALRDPPFIKLDLITCRNLLIYLQRDLQRQLCRLFHYALNPNGFLFLGSAETIDASPALFGTVDRDARIFEAKTIPDQSAPALPQLTSDLINFAPSPIPPLPAEPPVTIGQAHAAGLEQHSPPSVLVDRDHRILHLSPTAGRFLLPPEGPFTSELPVLMRPELRVDLKLALQRAFERNESTLTMPLLVAFNGDRRRVGLQVTSYESEMGGDRRALVFFLDGGIADFTEEPSTPDSNQELKRLREELAMVHNRLSSSRKEHEQASEDLRAANEELRSINEEYRSTAEELETSKEELQSMNEELQTVNSELKKKLETISSAHNDLQNLMAATEIGTLFLDPELRIKLFTPAVAEYFKITDADIGRSISDFKHRLVHDGIEEDAQKVLKSLVPIESEVVTKDNRWLMMRLRPYRTIEDRIDGVVATFMDITTRKHAEDALARELQAMSRLQQLSTKVVESSDLKEPLEAILETAIELLGADFGNIQLYHSRSQTLHIAAERGFEKRFLDYFAEVDASDGASCGIALARRQQVVIEDVEKEPAVAPTIEEARAAGYRAVQSTPLFTTGGKLVGVLSTHFREPRQFAAHELRLIDICARQASDAINAYLLQESLRVSEGRLRKVLETDAVGVMFLEQSGTLVDSNDAFLKMTGYTREDVAGRELSWQSLTPPEWTKASEAQLETLARTGRLGPYEKEFFCKGGSRKWGLFAGRKLDDGIIAKYCIDISDRKRAEDERELLAGELSHRVKNTLAVVQALASQTDGRTVEDFRESFIGRVQAMARAHGLLLDANWRNADLKHLVGEAVEAYRVDGPQGHQIEGEPVHLTPKQTLGLSFAFHELATNAVKYGALSRKNGRLNIYWHVETAESGRQVRLHWIESGGPQITMPGKKGFGTSLIERACAYELGGQVEQTYAPDGLICEIVFPVTSR